MNLTWGRSHNLLVGRPPREVEHNIREILKLYPVSAAFQEAGGYLRIIRALADEYGYRVIVFKGEGKGMNSSVLLVKKEYKRLASGVAAVWRDWIGPRVKIRWPGRSIPWEVTEVDGSPVLFASIHAPTGKNGRNPLNKLSYRKYMRRLRRLYRRLKKKFPGLRVFYQGDWNCGVMDKDKLSVRKLVAERIGAHVVNPNSKPHIDFLVTHVHDVDGKAGPRYKSDHDSTVYVEAA